MKKIFLISLISILISNINIFAMSGWGINRQTAELLSSKPDDPVKLAKKQAKKLKKEGWEVPIGERDIETQIIIAAQMENEMVTGTDGKQFSKYIARTARQTAGSHSAAYSAAIVNARTQIASELKTKISAKMTRTLETKQTSRIDASTVDAFNEKAEAIVDQTLQNSRPVINILRFLPNNNVEVQVRILVEKADVAEEIKNNMIHQLNLANEGKSNVELCGLVDDTINEIF